MSSPPPPKYLPLTSPSSIIQNLINVCACYGSITSSFLISGDFNYIEFKSNSKSGQFFFYSHDGKFMIKTQTRAESKFLRRILPRYYMYIIKNADTLVTRFYGMHRVKMKYIQQNMHFVIMQSVFDTKKEIHAIYDLKGSSVGRFSTKEELANPNCVQKDNDFHSSGASIELGEGRKRAFMRQLQSDVDFLAKMKIMDYSLLLGIHRHTSSSAGRIRTLSFYII